MGRYPVSPDSLREHDLVCDCAIPKSRRVSRGALSLLICEACERFLLGERNPNEVAALRRDVAALRVLVEALQREETYPASQEAPPASRVPLRVLPGGLQSPRRRNRRR